MNNAYIHASTSKQNTLNFLKLQTQKLIKIADLITWSDQLVFVHQIIKSSLVVHVHVFVFMCHGPAYSSHLIHPKTFFNFFFGILTFKLLINLNHVEYWPFESIDQVNIQHISI